MSTPVLNDIRRFEFVMPLSMCVIVLLSGCETVPQKQMKPLQGVLYFPPDVVKIAFADTPPRLIHRVPPIYPEIWKRENVGGEVLMAFTIETDGTTSNLEVIRANDTAFADSARVAVSQWRFSPGRKNGILVRIGIEDVVIFTPP
jgi:TonB family protein